MILPFLRNIWDLFIVTAMSLKIVIYQDDGVGEFGVRCLLNTFKTHDVRLCTARDVIDGKAFDGANLFFMPGGADLPYCHKLNGTGNANIRRFVHSGGTYLGLCAGAYYGCRAIEYHKGRPDEICGFRELAFIDAVAIGSLTDLAPPYDQSLLSAAIIPITTKSGEVIPVFYHGGPYFYFLLPIPDTTTIHATYPNGQPAIIETRVGHGRVVLSGVHLEFGVNDLSIYPAKDETECALIPSLQESLNEKAAKSLLTHLIEEFVQ
jgi:glutamine amidotransferase-like uncharacterized protein